jgi:ketosteroid isomerase-like protein
VNTRPFAMIAAAAWMLAACSGREQPAAGSAAEFGPMPAEPAAEAARLLNEFDPDALGKLLTDNARLLPPNVPAIEGRDAILEYYDGIVGETIKYEATPLNAVTVGNVGLAEGSYRVKNLTTGADVETGKYLMVWVNQDGQWKIARIVSNSDAQVPRTSVEVAPETAGPAR